VSGRRSRDKGGRAEREIVALHREMGLDAHRVPLSGAVVGYKGDVLIGDFRCEVKARASGAGFATIERWLGDFDILFLRRDRKTPLIVMPWRTWQKVMQRESGVGIVGAGAADATTGGAQERTLRLPSRD
jgi:hypothetical protein